MRRALIATGLIVATTAGAATATQPVSPYDDATWTKGTTVAGYKLAPDLYNWPMLVGDVSVRGPEGAFATKPVVGQRFYIRTKLAWFTNPWAYVDTYKTSLLLPDGLAPAISAADDVICAITTTDNVTVRVPGASECQDPRQVGLNWVFPAVPLDEGQMVQFWFPVAASKPLTDATIQMLGQPTLNPGNILPSPIVSEVKVTVNAAPVNAAPTTPGGGTPGGTTGTAPSSVAAKTTPSGGTVVSWVPSSAPGVTGYRVQQRLVGTKKWKTAGTTKASAKTFKLKKVKRGKKYQVRVATLVGGKVVAWSAPITVTAK